MAYTAFSTADIEAGDPVSQELWDLTRTNFADHETRISTNEAALANQFLPIQFLIIGGHWKAGTTGLAFFRVQFDITLTDARLYLPQDGDSGTTTVDVEVSAAGGGSFTTIFSSKPSLASGGGDHSLDQGTLSTTDIDAGELLRLDLDAVQVGSGEIHLILAFEAR